MTTEVSKCGNDCQCHQCIELKGQISEIRRQLDAFQILAERNPHVSSSLLIETIRGIIDEDKNDDDNKKDLERIEYKPKLPCKVHINDHLPISPRHEKIKGRIHMEPHGHIETNWSQIVSNFDEMNLDPALLRGIFAYGFEYPSAIQRRVIVPAIRGWDVIAQAPAETGRTAAIVIAVLQRIQRDNPHCQALFLTLTADAALKIRMLVLGLGAYLGISCHTCDLGHDDDLLKMRQGRQIVIGTPSDVYRMLIHRTVTSHDVRILVIDDGDKLLADGLKEDTFAVMKSLDLETQIVIMSITMPPEIMEETKKFMRHPVTIFVQDEAKHQRTLKGLKEFFIDVDAEEWKLPTLCNLYEKLGINQAIVFCNTSKKVDWLSRRIMEKGFHVSAMHGDFEDEDREVILREFGSATLPIAIATTEAALKKWGVKDDPEGDIPIVIIYDFPMNPKNYIQRCWFGRRFGGDGIAISLITAEDKRAFQAVQVVLGSRIEPLPDDLSNFLTSL